MPKEKQVDALGPVGTRLANRLAALRHAAGLTQGELATKLTDLGRPMQLSALSRIEKGQRRVDADDLVALALALDVTPNHLLLPDISDAGLTSLTPTTDLTTTSAWRWATRDAPDTQDRRGIYISYSHQDGANDARWLAETLRDAGHEVWFDQWEVSIGSNVNALIREGLERSSAVFLAMSSAYSTTEWSRREFDLVRAMPGQRLVPVRFSEHPTPALINDYIGLDLVGLNLDQARERVIEAADALAHETPHRRKGHAR